MIMFDDCLFYWLTQAVLEYAQLNEFIVSSVVVILFLIMSSQFFSFNVQKGMDKCSCNFLKGLAMGQEMAR